MLADEQVFGGHAVAIARQVESCPGSSAVPPWRPGVSVLAKYRFADTFSKRNRFVSAPSSALRQAFRRRAHRGDEADVAAPQHVTLHADGGEVGLHRRRRQLVVGPDVHRADGVASGAPRQAPAGDNRHRLPVLQADAAAEEHDRHIAGRAAAVAETDACRTKRCPDPRGRSRASPERTG